MIKQLEAFGLGKAEVFSELRSRQYLEMQGQRAERGAPLRNEIRSVIASQYGILPRAKICEKRGDVIRRLCPTIGGQDDPLRTL